MNSIGKKSPGARGIPQPFNRPAGHAAQFKPVVAQLKTAVSAQPAKRPVAPPVFRPQATPNAVQPRMAIGAVNRKPPVAPPVYRPQPTPKVLQKKAVAGPPPLNKAAERTQAVPVYRPQPTPKVLQTKRAAPFGALRPTLARPPSVLHVQTMNRPLQLKMATRSGGAPHTARPGMFGQKRVIQRAEAVTVTGAKTAAISYSSDYTGNTAEEDFATWYDQRGYWQSLPNAYEDVKSSFFFNHKMKLLDQEIVRVNTALRTAQFTKPGPALKDEIKQQLGNLIGNYDVDITAVGDINPRVDIEPNQMKAAQRIKTALVALGDYVNGMISSPDMETNVQAALLKKKGFVDKVLEAFTGAICHNEYAKGLMKCLNTIQGGLKS